LRNIFLSAEKEGGTSSTAHTHPPHNKSAAKIKKNAAIVGSLSLCADDAGLVMWMMMMMIDPTRREEDDQWVFGLVR